ncbi:protein kinase domain-containing protein [Endozoicomonas arenosclerae]|uniref:protein kinase domain-containing protein n=1 Tax=Endozoicomonas arenosclerae TaxID=1633495 RepID=UPI001294842B|nr:protein kinase [Endozoicomonas arenosclerae]
MKSSSQKLGVSVAELAETEEGLRLRTTNKDINKSFRQRNIDQHKEGQASGQKTIGKNIDCGIQVKVIVPGIKLEFRDTAKSVHCDDDLGNPVTCREDAEQSSVCLASGSNGCVVGCKISGMEAVAKRSYCFIDPDDGKPIYSDANGIIREAGVLTGLEQHARDHPGFINIVPFMGAGVTSSGEPLIFLEKADNSLERQLSKGALSLSQLSDLGQDLFSGLACMSSLNLVHQDIKPANLLLKGQTLWVADFGETTSKTGFASSGIDGVVLADNERVAGTREIKPFHATFEPPLPASDIWASGLTLLTMLDPQKMLDSDRAFLNQFHSFPFDQLPYIQLSEEQQQQLREQIHGHLDSFLEESLKGDDARFIPALADFFYQVFEPDCNQRISAHDAARALKMYQKTIFRH